MSTSNLPKVPDDSKPFRVRRGRVDSVDLYEVKAEELLILQNGDPNSLLLNIAIALFSLAFSSILAICTATFTNPIFGTLFLFVAIIGVIGSIVLALIWNKFRKPARDIIKVIKDRIPPDEPDTCEAPQLPE